MAQLEERWHINPEVAGWNPVSVHSKQCIYETSSVSLVVYLIIRYKKSYPLQVIPRLPLPRLYHNMGVWSLAMRHAVVQWLLTSAPPPPQKQSYWHNRENAKIGPNGSVGRPLAHYSVGCRFRSSSSKYFFVTQICTQICIHMSSAWQLRIILQSESESWMDHATDQQISSLTETNFIEWFNHTSG